MQRAITDESFRVAEPQTNAISEVLAEKIGQQKYRIWFKNSTRMTLTDTYLKIVVPNLFIARSTNGTWLYYIRLEEGICQLRALE